MRGRVIKLNGPVRITEMGVNSSRTFEGNVDVGTDDLAPWSADIQKDR